MSEDNREKLLNAGIDLLSEKTFSEISMDQVAERSGVSKPMIYYYFNNKEGYYRGLAEHLLKIARSMMQKLYDPEISMRENLKRYVRFRIDFVEESPGIANAFLSIITDPNIGMLINELQEEFDIMRMEFIDPMFDRAVESGEVTSGVNRMIVMMMLNSLLVSYTVKKINKLCGHDEMKPEEVVDIIFDGIAAAREDTE
ncbi:MAG: TetR/AcrR family transcriptional regulator [Candidatus Fermentibacteraceae bacterium]|nr:TetR/AcrR family transcriptional regulator [Candidatus Fermentibacteraceae bacterium]MBN2609537.1 TetR/AcrR family transcriptional regulator [Candidatus Fermentibacteraceae bacterium]